MQSLFTLKFSSIKPTVLCSQFLKQCLVSVHAEQVDRWLAAGMVRLNGQPIIKDSVCGKGDRLELDIPGHQEALVDANWQLVWENDELMAINKPPLLPVSRTTRNLYMTLISLVRRQTPYPDAQLLHRLDTETSGLILLAKNREADRKWKPQLAKLIRRKVYQAWVHGSPNWERFLMECELSEKAGSDIRSQVYVVEPQSDSQYLKPRPSKTEFLVLQRKGSKSLIQCELFTGRKHQIRAQLAHLGHPIIGDKIYSHDGAYYLKRLEQALTSKDFEALGATYHMLSASLLEIALEDKTVVEVGAARFHEMKPR